MVLVSTNMKDSCRATPAPRFLSSLGQADTDQTKGEAGQRSSRSKEAAAALQGCFFRGSIT